MADEIVDLAPTTIEDPRVRDGLNDLILASIHWTREQLAVGRPDVKLNIVRTILPAVARGLANTTDDDGAKKEARDKIEGLFAQVRGDQPAPP